MHFWEIQLLNIDLCLCQMVSQLGFIKWIYFLIQTFNSSLLLSRFKRTFNTNFSLDWPNCQFPVTRLSNLLLSDRTERTNWLRDKIESDIKYQNLVWLALPSALDKKSALWNFFTASSFLNLHFTRIYICIFTISSIYIRDRCLSHHYIDFAWRCNIGQVYHLVLKICFGLTSVMNEAKKLHKIQLRLAKLNRLD